MAASAHKNKFNEVTKGQSGYLIWSPFKAQFHKLHKNIPIFKTKIQITNLKEKKVWVFYDKIDYL